MAKAVPLATCVEEAAACYCIWVALRHSSSAVPALVAWARAAGGRGGGGRGGGGGEGGEGANAGAARRPRSNEERRALRWDVLHVHSQRGAVQAGAHVDFCGEFELRQPQQTGVRRSGNSGDKA